jgi:response regulator RpfG family c-di-GMP phosphodiesterase
LRENIFIENIEEFIAGKKELSPDETKEFLSKMLKEYKRKAKRVDRIFQQNDRQQKELDRLNSGLEEQNTLLHDEIIQTQKEIVFRMGDIAESRSKETGNHIKRVSLYSYILAKKYGLSKFEIDLIRDASPMHDIGKVGVPDNILNKPSRYTPEEFEIMKTHTTIGYNLFKDSKRPLLQMAATIAYEHHEKWIGNGYPRGLKGEEISIYGRITAVADVFDALGSARVYKKAWSLERIIDLFEDERGKHFDPDLIDIFFENFQEFVGIRNRYED